MPIKIIRQNHQEIIGRGTVLLSSPPAADQTEDFYAGHIVEDAALLSRAHAMIGKEWKRDLDPSALQGAQAEFEAGTQSFLEEHGVQCVITISGMNEPGIEIRANAMASRGETLELGRARLALDFDLTTSREKGETSGRDLGYDVQTVLLALGPDERGFRKDAVVAGITDAVGLINAKLGVSETDKRTSETLD